MQCSRILFVVTSLLPLHCSYAQRIADYPAKPVRVIVTVAPGGSADLQARMVAQKLSERLKYQFVVDNRAGGGGAVGYGLAAKSVPDGYTLMAVAPSVTWIQSAHPEIQFDPRASVAPISLVARSPFLLLVHPAVSVNSVGDMIKLAKSKPDVLNIGVTNGGITHLAAAWFKSLADIKVTIVPYKGAAPVMVDALAGQIQMIFGNVLIALPHMKAGRLKALAVTSAKRSVLMPELPTITESGVVGYDVTTWHGWLAPAHTPVYIVDKLSAEIAKAVHAPEIAKKLADDGGEAVGSTPDEFRRLINDEVARWAKVIKDSGIAME